MVVSHVWVLAVKRFKIFNYDIMLPQFRQNTVMIIKMRFDTPQSYFQQSLLHIPFQNEWWTSTCRNALLPLIPHIFCKKINLHSNQCFLMKCDLTITAAYLSSSKWGWVKQINMLNKKSTKYTYLSTFTLYIW